MPGTPAKSARLVALLTLACAAGALGCGAGCASGGRDLPRDRLGALPFPGLMTLYATADPARLGTHRSGHWPRLFGEDEAERGIIYTERAGFLDLAHVRIAIDWMRYCTLAAHDALAAGRTELALPGPDRAVFHVTLAYPPEWFDLPEQRRGAAAEAQSHPIGQRLAYLMLTWHEIATWFGYRTTFFADESPSAFTYDDSVSHLVGMRVAERAMRDGDGGGRGFDEAVTVALDAELRRLGAVSPRQTNRAVRAVEGLWWAAARPLKRQLHLCPGDDEVVYPWLVPNKAGRRADVPPEVFPLPHVGAGAEAVRACIAIEPRIGEARAMRALLPGQPARFRDDRDLPLLLRAVGAQMQARYGSAVGEPWPDGAAPAGAGDSARTPQRPPEASG